MRKNNKRFVKRAFDFIKIVVTLFAFIKIIYGIYVCWPVILFWLNKSLIFWVSLPYFM